MEHHMLRALLVLVFAALALTASAQSQPDADVYAPGRDILAGIGKIVTPNGVQETLEVTLGGARQIVNVRGADRANPIIVFIHGGPGAVEMPFAWTFQKPWEDFFTVVQWDQRGAGRSYPLNDPTALAATLTIDRYRDDTIELIELLCRKYGQRKVILIGHSWGSVVGLSVALKRPDLLYAYVGMGQYIDPLLGERAGFAWTLEQARRDANAQAMRELNALQPYPGAFEIERIDAERKWAVHYGALFAGRDDGQFYFNTARLSPEYSPADRKAWGEGSAYTVKIVEPRLTAITFKNVHKIDCPVFMFLGRHDWLVPSTITEAWFDELRAPKKGKIWFENSAHMMMFEEPGRVFASLLEQVRPLSADGGAGSRKP
jgi:proline iminopeptidase